MDIPYRYNGRPSPPLTFIGDDSTERRSSLTMPMQENRIIQLHDPIDAVSCNKNQDKIVCAGSRGVLRVFQVTDQCLIPLLDLKKVAAKNKSRTPLLYSPSNVAWSKLRDDLIATTSTIGAVVLWNVEQQKIENHWKAHTRSATVVRFHRQNPNIMISGSKDSCIFVYDIREEKPTQEMRRGIQETVRDLMFSHIEGDEHHFLSADDGGIVKVWDMRNPSLPQQARQLHQGYISCIQSHPNRPYEVATGGGRDKRVKIWNWKEDSRRYKQVETLAPVGRINWRPDNEFQLATCAVVHEVNVLLWDIRRPHMPMISFPGHTDSVTDVFWSRMEPHRIVSVGKDNLVILQNLADGDQTIDHLCDAQIDVAPDGLIVFALNADHEDKKKPRWEVNDVQLQLKKMRNSSDKRREAAARVLEQRRINNQLINRYEPFSHNVKSDVTLGIPSSVQYSLQNRLFEAYARNYVLGGRSIADMCEHNAMVSRYQMDETRERLWRYVGGLLAGARFQEFYEKEDEEQKIVQDKKWNIYIKEHVNQGKVPLIPPQPKPEVPFAFMVNRSRKVARQLYDPKNINEKDINVFEFLTELSSECEYGEQSLDGLKSETPNGDEFCGLPEEAFGIKRYFQDVSQATIAEPNSWKTPEERKKYQAEEILVQQLHYLAHQGDMQMCASIATIAGHRLADTLSDYFIEAWVQSYMDMLYRLQLYETIAALRKYTCVERIRLEGGDGTTFRPHVWHTRRNEAWGDSIRMGFKKTAPAYALCKGKLKNGNCDKCYDPIVPVCSLCDGPIEGLTWNCMKCSHSMHIDHAFVWFRERVQMVDDADAGEGEELTAEKLRKRRLRLAMGADRAIHDHTNTCCPVPNCDCDCLDEEEQDEMEANKPQPVHSVEWMKRQLVYDKYRRPARFRRQKKKKKSKKDQRRKKRASLLEKIDIRAGRPEYDFVPEKASFYKELVKGAKTDEETQLCAMVKMIMALPAEYKPQIKEKLEQPRKGEVKEEEKKRPSYGVLLGLTSKEKAKEPKIRRRTSRSRSRASESQRAERAKILWEYNQKRQMARWREILMDDETSDEDEPMIITGEKEKLFGGRNYRPKYYDILRCIFWGLLRRMKKVQRRRRRTNHKKRKIKQKMMYSVFKRIRRKRRRKAQTIRKFLELIDKRKRKRAGERMRFAAEMKKANMTASTMAHFVGLRLKPKFVRNNGRIVFANPTKEKPGRRRRRTHHIAKIYVIRRFVIGKRRRRRQRRRKTFPIRGIEPEDLVPSTLEEVKARKITTARNTATSRSGPTTPNVTDYQI